jgi:3-methyladenine DNA glycosylase AlkD
MWEYTAYYQTLKDLARPENAEAMRAYMRHQFDFLGIKSPERKELLRMQIKTYGLPDKPAAFELIEQLWNSPERECQYLAMELLEKYSKKLEKKDLAFLESLVCRKSWWDTVDMLAQIIGSYFRLFPEELAAVNRRWLDSNTIWLQRCTLIFQLKYKKDTNESLLLANCRELAASKEFFIQKAIGWALRQYARTNPKAVKTFVEQTPLAPLSRREALKHIG